MAKQTHKQQHQSARRDEDLPEKAAAAGEQQGATLGDDVDAILGEIDEVLEENAEDFVRSYVQKGGE